MNDGEPTVAGLIPAHAGNTYPALDSSSREWAHPRSRGEHSMVVRERPPVVGSSPLARGTLEVLDGAGHFFGGAHPRSRGEHTGIGDVPLTDVGSSPLARGTLWPRWLSPHPTGLIPARAGNTLRPRCRSCRIWAHPRSRGEHKKNTIRAAALAGSSPLARGTQQTCQRLLLQRGLIPARAGNTPRRAKST